MRCVACLISMASFVAPASASETITYSYDAQGRLVQVTHSGTVNNGQQATYSLDPTDNRNNVTVVGAPH